MNIKERYNRTKEFIEKYKVEIIGCGLVILAVNHNKTLKNLAAASMDHSKAIGNLQHNMNVLDADMLGVEIDLDNLTDRSIKQADVIEILKNNIQDINKTY